MGPNVQKGCLTLIIVVMSVALTACLQNGDDSGGNDKVTLSDAYCINGTFQFDLMNKMDSNISLTYEWSLNDPKADRPIYEGAGELNLTPGMKETIVNHFQNTSYDARFFLMYINVTIDGKKEIQYMQQKSLYNWDYSELPPTRKD